VNASLEADFLQKRRFPIQTEGRIFDDGTSTVSTKHFDALDDGRFGLGVVKDEVVVVTVSEIKQTQSIVQRIKKTDHKFKGPIVKTS
jgi:hypothetical protein